MASTVEKIEALISANIKVVTTEELLQLNKMIIKIINERREPAKKLMKVVRQKASKKAISQLEVGTTLSSFFSC